MTTTPQNTSNSGSELEQALDTYTSQIEDSVNRQNMQYIPKYKVEFCDTINRLYIKRSDVVGAIGPKRVCAPDCHNWLVGTCDNVKYNEFREEILTKLGLLGEQEDK